MTVVVNGRFLRAQPSGMHRAARALVDAARDAALPLEVLAPPGVVDHDDLVRRCGHLRGDGVQAGAQRAAGVARRDDHAHDRSHAPQI